jgi:hypothetical protein
MLAWGAPAPHVNKRARSGGVPVRSPRTSDPRHAQLIELNMCVLTQDVEHRLGQILDLQSAGFAVARAGRWRHLHQTGTEGMHPNALMLNLFPQRLGEP